MTIIERSAIGLVYFCSYMMLQLVGTLVGMIFGLDLMGSTALGLFACLIVFVILSKKFDIPLWHVRSITFKNLLWTLIIGLASLFGTDRVIQLLPDIALENQSVIEMMAEHSSLVATTLATVIAAPIVEEVLFRRVLMGHVFKNYQLMGYVASTALFAVLHSGTELVPFVIYFMLGSGMAFIYWKTQSIECAILWHMINNGLAVAQLYMLMAV